MNGRMSQEEEEGSEIIRCLEFIQCCCGLVSSDARIYTPDQPPAVSGVVQVFLSRSHDGEFPHADAATRRRASGLLSSHKLYRRPFVTFQNSWHAVVFPRLLVSGSLLR